ncbi:deoxyribonuclease V [Candidatus Hakubella thermalkaliphila]|uniref:Endonuclease V n=1 Tax=Candidatus Hakubella thermalkaliphila TaxID=2754717 RepID=A0A6V8PJ28_9ACTN|nr:Endonuclease V [Actinomycetota bacterium]GFP32261.1 deoxyribonuclease V [Candidatus Hakubella thermalkaliphila]GFP32268.1 deoxyribonuclease V [Candidatus Hakubella thermalkaliphila]
MKIPPLHPWNVSVEEALRIQNELRERVVLRDQTERIRTVTAVDVGYPGPEKMALGCAITFTYPDLRVVGKAFSLQEVSFPYIPGLLAFREAPVIISALQKLEGSSDLLIVDGQGYAHPRYMGLATHLGIYLDMSSVGCAKSHLWGTYGEPAPNKGSYEYLRDGEQVVGAVLRTKDRVTPVFVSPGHKISLERSIRVILSLCKFRIPEPLRIVHQELKRMRAPLLSTSTLTGRRHPL